MTLMEVTNNINNFCTDTANVWQVIGYVLTAFKIIMPLLLIIFGMFDLGKAVTSSKDDEIKKATLKLMKRAIAAVIIFFIPTLVSVVFGLIVGFDELKSNYKICKNCLTNPTNEKCSSLAKRAWEK